MKSDFIWIDGHLVPYEETTVHMLSPALHYGMAVFEGIRCYNTNNSPRSQEWLDMVPIVEQSMGI